MDSLGGLHRPRNVDWKRAAALLYGDWGTSKAYVIGLAFVAAGYACLPIVLAVCLLTAVVGYNYIVICRLLPDGGGVYSAARTQSRLLAVMGALLLVANFAVTAAMSGWAAMGYFGVPKPLIPFATIALILIIGAVNFFGPKHSGSLAVSFAVPMVIVVLIIILLSLPHLTLNHLRPNQGPFSSQWVAFTGVILALSGVEAIASLTGVLKLNPGSTMEEPSVSVTARKAILPIALEVVLGTSLLAWAMLSLPESHATELSARWEDMIRYLAEQYGALALGNVFGQVFGWIVGGIVGLLLLSAVNTAVAALIGLFYMMARDGEMPRGFTKLNSFGVPRWPLFLSVSLPASVVAFSANLQALAGLYAIGVVGAITVNLGSCSFNQMLKMRWFERGFMVLTFLVLFAVELTIARTKPDALFFAICVLGAGLGLRTLAQRHAGLRTVTVSTEIAAAVAPESVPNFRPNLSAGQKVLVAARGLTPVLRYALEEARLRQAALYVLYVREVAVSFSVRTAPPEPARWQDDKRARQILYTMLTLGKENEVTVLPLYAVSDRPALTILDLAATLGVDFLMLGSSHRSALVGLLKGNVVTEVARNLPENIQLVIHG